MPTRLTQRPVDAPRTDGAPRVAFRELRAVWFQLSGTLCNLACRHCFNASGPRNPWLTPLDAAVVRRSIAEAEALGVREFYVTGGEPFLHPDLFPLLECALAVAPTTVLTNGTLVDEAVADRLAAIADGSRYSLEVRVSLDGATAVEHDTLRGRGSFDKALRAIVLLADRRLYPIVTATAVVPSPALYDRLRGRLLEAGVERPRIKILPVLPLGRAAGFGAGHQLTVDELTGFDTAHLQCTETRVVADGGVYACPILAGLPGARMATESLADALGPAPLYHPACRTCYETGLTCANV